MERVLIVEDDENIRQLLKLTLASFNYELVDFENGKDAYAVSYTHLTLPTICSV